MAACARTQDVELPSTYPLPVTASQPKASSEIEDGSSVATINPIGCNVDNSDHCTNIPNTVTLRQIFRKLSSLLVTALCLGTNFWMVFYSHGKQVDTFLEHYKEYLKTSLILPPILLMSIYALIPYVTGPAVAFLLASSICIVIAVAHIFAFFSCICIIPRAGIPSIPASSFIIWQQKSADFHQPLPYTWPLISLVLPLTWLAWGLLLFTVAIPVWAYDQPEGDLVMLTPGSRIAIITVTVCGIGSLVSCLLTWRKYIMPLQHTRPR